MKGSEDGAQGTGVLIPLLMLGSACGLHFTATDEASVVIFHFVHTEHTAQHTQPLAYPKFVYVEKSSIPAGKTEYQQGKHSGRSTGESWQLHPDPDPAIRPSVKRAETIEKDRRERYIESAFRGSPVLCAYVYASQNRFVIAES